MGVSFASYEIARSGLYVSERALFVTGHNISNVNTPGYVRQQAIIKNGPVHRSYHGNRSYYLGLGADMQQIRQIRHFFLDSVYRQENTSLGYWEARSKTLDEVQAILSEPMSSGLQNVLNQFWDSWQELSKEPDSLTVRALVRQRGEALAHHINHLGDQIDKLQSDINSEIKIRIDEVNSLSKEIAGLNIEILKAESHGDTANDYRDQRNTCADRLAKLIDCQINEASDGQIEITAGGYFIVNKAQNTRLAAEEARPGSGFYVTRIEGSQIEIPLKSGMIKGLLESRGEVAGIKGSFENGTPAARADVVFAIDISDGSEAYLSDISENIHKYVDSLKKYGIDYNLKLITYGAGVQSSISFGRDEEALYDALPVTATGGDASDFGQAGGLLEEIEETEFRDNALRLTYVFTGKGVDGVTDTAPLEEYVQRLGSEDVKLSVITGEELFTEGLYDGSTGWGKLSGASGGNLYNISSDPGEVAAQMASDANTAVNESICDISETSNILSDMRTRLNAMVNVMLRTVNYIHSSGTAIGNPPRQGEDFFTAIDDKYPLEAGNIMINSNLTNLNNIVVSDTGDSGDNNIALKIANSRHDKILSDPSGKLSVDEYYQALILRIGYLGYDSARIMQNQQNLVNAADHQRISVTGVSMDEEMTDMMKYKFAYNAASRALNTIDEMIRTVIEKTGIAGR